MLNNTNWDLEKKVETKPDVFSLEGLIAWLEKQNPEKRYHWLECDMCVCGQYLKAMGVENFDSIERGHLRIFGPGKVISFRGVAAATYEKVAAFRPWTLGAALSRAREELSLRALSAAKDGSRK